MLSTLFKERRNRLKGGINELLECLKLWFRLGVFTQKDIYAIVSSLTVDGTMEALEAIDQ